MERSTFSEFVALTKYTLLFQADGVLRRVIYGGVRAYVILFDYMINRYILSVYKLQVTSYKLQVTRRVCTAPKGFLEVS